EDGIRDFHVTGVQTCALRSLLGNTYEVDGDLGSRQVTLRYDPYDLREIQVWFEGVRRGNAKPVELRRYRDRRIPADEAAAAEERSEERRVGKECGERWFQGT